MSMELAEVRRLIQARRRRGAEVSRRHRAHLAYAAAQPRKRIGVRVRCDLPTHDNAMPKLAEVQVTSVGTFFVSRIPWSPSDQLTLRPWDREQMMGVGLTEMTFDLVMTDDDYLRDWLLQLDDWTAGLPSDGPRWLRKMMHPRYILEVLDLPDVAGRLGLWMRCPKHLHAYEEASVDDLLAATR